MYNVIVHLYHTVFGRNVVNLTQLLPKASKKSNRNDKFLKVFRNFIGAFKKTFNGLAQVTKRLPSGLTLWGLQKS
jgi:hypothetical protein